MKVQIKFKNIIATFLVMVFIAGQSLDAFAQSGRGRPDRRQGPGPEPYYYTPHYEPHGRAVHDLPRGYIRLIMGGLEYFYWEGMFYRMMSDRYVIVPAPVGAIVTAIPQGSQPVIVDGVAYYNINGVTYMYTQEGYQVVPTPKTIIVKNYVVEQKKDANTSVPNNAAGTESENLFTVNIPNSKGNYTAVTLKRSGSGFVGPQGEYYTEFPKIEQLKVMYGK